METGHVTHRGVRRIITREDLWGSGNRERVRSMFASRDSLYVWAIKSHGKQRTRYLALAAEPGYAHVAIVRLRSPRAAASWLSDFLPGDGSPNSPRR